MLYNLRMNENHLRTKAEYNRIYYKHNKGWIKKKNSVYAKNHPEIREKARKNYLSTRPWLFSHSAAKQRCTNPKSIAYKYYGGRGILFLLTMEDTAILWNRDGAAAMDSPTLDRVDNDGNYEMSNCRFIERADNSRRNAGRPRKKTSKYWSLA